MLIIIFCVHSFQFHPSVVVANLSNCYNTKIIGNSVSCQCCARPLGEIISTAGNIVKIVLRNVRKIEVKPLFCHGITENSSIRALFFSGFTDCVSPVKNFLKRKCTFDEDDELEPPRKKFRLGSNVITENQRTIGCQRVFVELASDICQLSPELEGLPQHPIAEDELDILAQYDDLMAFPESPSNSSSTEEFIFPEILTPSQYQSPFPVLNELFEQGPPSPQYYPVDPISLEPIVGSLSEYQPLTEPVSPPYNPTTPGYMRSPSPEFIYNSPENDLYSNPDSPVFPPEFWVSVDFPPAGLLGALLADLDEFNQFIVYDSTPLEE